MAVLGNIVFDEGLGQFADVGSAKTLYILNMSTDPADRSQVVDTDHRLAVFTGSTIYGSPADRGAGGRQVTIAAISTGEIDVTGTARRWAITDTDVLLAANTLSDSQSVTTGNTFTLAAFTIGIPDPA